MKVPSPLLPADTRAGRGTGPCTGPRACLQSRHAHPSRRAWLTRSLALPAALSAALKAALPVTLIPLVSGCAGPAPDPRRLRLPDLADSTDLPKPSDRPSNRPPPALPWQLMEPLVLPAWLDDDRIWRPDGPSGLRPIAGLRWAEPLRDALPRALQQDLAAALGGPGQVWRAPLAPGLRIGRQLRLQIEALQPDPSGRNMLLQAQWSLASPDGAQPPQVGTIRWAQPLSGPQPDALALAMRQALQRLAGQIVAEAR